MNLNATETAKTEPLSGVDTTFTLEIGDDVVVRRASDQENADRVRGIIECGLLHELQKRGLIPETTVVDRAGAKQLPKLKQKRIAPVIYPYEWSPEMFRLAALCTLKVNQCANEFGYELKDAHPYNVVFQGLCPLFVDLGSLIARKHRNYWCASEEFYRFFGRTLRLIKMGYTNLVRRSYLFEETGYFQNELAAITQPILLRVVGMHTLQRFNYYRYMYNIGPTIDSDAIERKYARKITQKIAKFVLLSPLLPRRKFNYCKLSRKIKRYKFKGYQEWSNYHHDFYDQNGNITLSPRMEWVLDESLRLAPSSILELAGNSGILARCLAHKLPTTTRIICNDIDPYAIDTLFNASTKHRNLFASCFNFIDFKNFPMQKNRRNRFQSDLVVAMAITHHLILSQGLSPEKIFSTFHAYCKKYLIVEFMPLGLWGGGEHLPAIPKWYTEEWFVTHMQKFFKICKRAELEKNRIAFVAEKHFGDDTDVR